jgi:hypothetical protein
MLAREWATHAHKQDNDNHAAADRWIIEAPDFAPDVSTQHGCG